MKKLLGSILLACPLLAFSTGIVLPVRGVIDGDTIATSLNLPGQLSNASVRIRGIDTPETTHLAKCSSEIAKGNDAKLFLTNFVGTQPTMIISNFKWDKFGGRIDADVEIHGTDIGTMMLMKNFARPYTGIGPKPDWCK